MRILIDPTFVRHVAYAVGQQLFPGSSSHPRTHCQQGSGHHAEQSADQSHDCADHRRSQTDPIARGQVRGRWNKKSNLLGVSFLIPPRQWKKPSDRVGGGGGEGRGWERFFHAWGFYPRDKEDTHSARWTSSWRSLGPRPAPLPARPAETGKGSHSPRDSRQALNLALLARRPNVLKPSWSSSSDMADSKRIKCNVIQSQVNDRGIKHGSRLYILTGHRPWHILTSHSM